MAFMLEFPPSGPFPRGINAPPYVVFGVYGNDITASLPPLIPIGVVLHFAPALRKWVLPAPDPAYLPRADAEEAVRKPHVGIDIKAPVETEGLRWIVNRMMHQSGCKVPKETFSVHPDLATSLAIHKTWLALELPRPGLLGLHTHIHVQLMTSSPPVGAWDMRMLWDNFPHDSGIVWAMGLNFMQGLVGLEYKTNESLEILVWLQSTPELSAFFKALQAAVPGYTGEPPSTAEEKDKTLDAGHQTDGKTGKAKTSMATRDPNALVDIMERGATKKVSLQDKKQRQSTDLQAMQSRLSRMMRNVSLRSVNTAIYDPQEEEMIAGGEEDGESVNDDMDDPGNYSEGSFSAELAKSLELIRLRRENRRTKNASSRDSPAKELNEASLQQHKVADASVSRVRDPRPRGSSSTTTTSGKGLTEANLQQLEARDTSISREGAPRHRRSDSMTTHSGKERSLLIADLQARLQALEEKRERFARHNKEKDTGDDEGESEMESGGYKKLEQVQ